MKILAVDSVSKTIEVTLLNEDKIVKKSIEGAKNASEHLLVMIDEILTEQNIELKAIDYIAINIGPGSFTGIRIAMSLVKGFMVSLPLKCVAVNSFDLLSYNINESDYAVVLDSGTSDYYVMVKEKGLTTFLAQNKEQIKTLSKKLKIYSQVNIDGVELTSVFPIDNAILECAKREIKCENFKTAFELEPLYLKKAQSEREYKQKFLSQLTFKKADDSDINQILDLENQNFTYDAYSKNQIMDDIEANRVLVAKKQEKIIGYLSFIETDNVEILKICTQKDSRNLGVAEKLINEMISLTKKDIFLEVSENNPAKNFYAKQGFKLINVRKNYYKDGQDALIMKKEI